MAAHMEPCAKCGAPINLKRDGFARDPEKGLLCPVCWEPQKPDHTPLPWVAEPEEASEGRGIAICSPTGDAIVATITPEDDRPADAIDWANARLIIRAANNHENLVAAYAQVEKASLDALHALNNAGLPCPASLGLALEKLRQIVGKARQEEGDALPG